MYIYLCVCVSKCLTVCVVYARILIWGMSPLRNG